MASLDQVQKIEWTTNAVITSSDSSACGSTLRQSGPPWHEDDTRHEDNTRHDHGTSSSLYPYGQFPTSLHHAPLLEGFVLTERCGREGGALMIMAAVVITPLTWCGRVGILIFPPPARCINVCIPRLHYCSDDTMSDIPLDQVTDR